MVELSGLVQLPMVGADCTDVQSNCQFMSFAVPAHFTDKIRIIQSQVRIGLLGFMEIFCNIDPCTLTLLI